jgi:hypothetical protein
MTRKIFQYLFLFSLLIALFFYVNGRNQSTFFNDKLDLSPTAIEQLIEDHILSLNSASKGNPILSPIGKNYIINKIQLVNHHWLLADFTNGERWGDILVYYKIDSKNKVSLQLIDHVFYP